MSRFHSAVVPPVPVGVTEDEMDAFRLWRSGLDIRNAAARAGISRYRLRDILDAAHLQNSKIREVA